MHVHPVIVIFLCGVLFSACAQDRSKQAPANPRLAQFYVRYLADELQVHAEASFSERASEGKAGVPVTLPQPPLFRNDRMKPPSKDGSTYAFEESSGFHTPIQFSWVSGAEQQHQLQLPVHAARKIGFDPSSLSMSHPARFSWDGEPFERGESIVFMWEHNKTRETVPMEIVPAPGSAYIDFPAAEIAKLSPGTWTLYVVRKQLRKGQVDNYQYQSVVEFFSDTIEVPISRS
jgi:hypothetical protein